MTGSEVFTIFSNVRLRNALSDIAGAFARDYETQKTLLAHAWIAIGEKPADYTIDAYIGIGYAVMRKKWEIYYMPEPKSKPSNNPSSRRAKRKVREYLNS